MTTATTTPHPSVSSGAAAWVVAEAEALVWRAGCVAAKVTVIAAHWAVASADHWLATPVEPLPTTAEPDEVTVWLLRESQRREPAHKNLQRPA